MKKILILIIALPVGTAAANAQFGNLIRKAAQKATEKATEKAIDQAEKSAEKAMDRGLEEADKAIDRGLDDAYGKSRDETATDSKRQSEDGEQPTYASLMLQALDVPTEQQLINHKSYELNEQSLKLLTSPVSRYVANIAMLTAQVATIPYSDIDSAEATDMAYDMAMRYSGLSRQEIEKLQTMSEAEQEAWLRGRYADGTAEAAVMDDAAELGKLLEPLQPTIDRWEAAGKEADEAIAAVEEECRKIYAGYADIITTAGDKERISLLLKYYREICPKLREGVLTAMKIRYDKQLPIAEELEKEIAKLRREHRNYVAGLLNYPMLTATQCMGDAARLTEMPEF